jgi:hypothetical protein
LLRRAHRAPSVVDGLDELVEHWTVLDDERVLVDASAVPPVWASLCC